MRGSASFSVAAGPGAGVALTRGLAGAPRGITRRGMGSASPMGISGTSPSATSTEGGITGCAKVTWAILCAGFLAVQHPPQKSVQPQASKTNRFPGRGFTTKATGIVGILRGERQLNTKSCSASHLRRKVYRTVMKLHNSEGAGKSDAAATWPRCKEKLKHLFPVLRRYSLSGVAHGDFGHFAAPAKS